LTATIETVSPVTCTSWCVEGDGHPDAEEPADQTCHAGEHRIDLAATPTNLSNRAGGHVAVHLYRDVYAGNGPTSGVVLEPPHIEVYSSGTGVLALSIAEGRELGQLLIAMANIAAPDDSAQPAVTSRS
jgi:hypothetical protein